MFSPPPMRNEAEALATNLEDVRPVTFCRQRELRVGPVLIQRPQWCALATLQRPPHCFVPPLSQRLRVLLDATTRQTVSMVEPTPSSALFNTFSGSMATFHLDQRLTCSRSYNSSVKFPCSACTITSSYSSLRHLGRLLSTSRRSTK